MGMKRKPHSTSLVLLLVCIFTFWWGISVLAQHDTSTITQSNTQPATTASQAAPLMVSESIKNDTYTYSGVYATPSACDSFGSGIRYSAEEGGHVSVLLITEPASTACAQAAGPMSGEPFTVSIKLAAGSNPAFDGVLLNGSIIPSQLVQAN
jgi:hypothetical protein